MERCILYFDKKEDRAETLAIRDCYFLQIITRTKPPDSIHRAVFTDNNVRFHTPSANQRPFGVFYSPYGRYTPLGSHWNRALPG